MEFERTKGMGIEPRFYLDALNPDKPSEQDLLNKLEDQIVRDQKAAKAALVDIEDRVTSSQEIA